jgi:hypothetical protein
VSVTTGAFQASIEHRAPRAAPSRTVAHEAAPRRTAPRSLTQAVALRTTPKPAHHPPGSPAHALHHVAYAQPHDAPAGDAASATPSTAAPQAGRETASTTPTAAPTDGQSPGPAPSAELARSVDQVPPGGWGQNFRDPTILDDTALNDLRTKYHGTVVLIEVDESGHATKISVQGGVDADSRAELERQLSAIRYVPAECNGLPCAASFKLTV